MMVSHGHDSAQLFRRLERTIDLIRRHPDYPGKHEALGRCREDIEARFLQGMLKDEERTRLLNILGDHGSTD